MNWKKGIGILIGVTATLGLASFIGVKTYYGSHFLWDSKINNVQVSNLKVAQAQRKISDKFKDTKITFTDKSGKTVASISELKFVDASMDKVTSLQKQKEHRMSIGLTKLKTELPKELVRLNLNANATDSVDAKLVRASKSKYIVTKEVYGNKIDYDKLQEATLKGIKAGQTTFKLSDFYIKPKVTHYNTKLTSTRDTLNKQLNTKVTVKVEDHTVAIPQETIQDSISTKGINAEPYLALLKQLDDKYSNYNTTLQVKSPTSGKMVDVKNKADSGYGWYIKPEATYAKIKALIMDKDKTSGTVEVEHAGTSYGEKTPFGGNYSVINLSNQYVYVYKNGKLSFKVPTITGKPTKGTVEQGGDGTDPGVHTIFSKLTHQTMVGKNDDGSTYHSPTKWITYFTHSGEAYHDASSWQASEAYGKVSSPYKVGSHGCANLSGENAKKVYDNTSVGDQVIVIGWLPRTAPSK